MLMVVFGAGASYDSVPAYPARTYPDIPDRLPLADQLFENRPHFAEAMSQFQRARPIIPYLQSRDDGIGIERVLQSLQDEAAEYPERHKQLAAVRYYLHFMLRRCEDQWQARAPGGATNQITLLDQIGRWRTRYGQVCLVTFNYDRMLETALNALRIEIQTVSDYIADDRYKLIKLHGSVNWGRRVRSYVADVSERNRWQIAFELIDRADVIETESEYHVINDYPIAKLDTSAMFPAIAIPVETKADYECPEEHLRILRRVIPEVDRMIIIGWRAAETPFLQLLAEHLQGPVRTLVVSGNYEAATETAGRLSAAGVEGEIVMSEGGFTELVVGRQADNFLSR